MCACSVPRPLFRTEHSHRSRDDVSAKFAKVSQAELEPHLSGTACKQSCGVLINIERGELQAQHAYRSLYAIPQLRNSSVRPSYQDYLSTLDPLAFFAGSIIPLDSTLLLRSVSLSTASMVFKISLPSSNPSGVGVSPYEVRKFGQVPQPFSTTLLLGKCQTSHKPATVERTSVLTNCEKVSPLRVVCCKSA